MDNFFGSLYHKARTNNKLNKALYGSWYSTGMPVNPTRSYTNDLVTGYTDNEVIYSIINKIAKTASNIPLVVVDSEGTPQDNHWATKLLQAPNEDTTITELVNSYYVYLLSIGNSYIYAPKLTDGRTLELWTMPSDIVEVVAGNWKNPIEGYKVMYGTQEEIMKKRTVLHSKLFNPNFQDSGEWMYGLSPIKVAAEIIRNINAGNERMALLAETGAPPFIISSQLPEGLTRAQQEMLEDSYNSKYGNISSTNKPMLTGTPVKVEMLGTNAADMELVKSSEYATRVLCNVYGIPSQLLNDTSGSTYNNVIELKKDFITSTVMPLNKQLAEKLTTFLLKDEDVRFEFDYSNVEELSKSIDERMIALDKVTFLSTQEKRLMFNYDTPLDEVQDEDDASE